MCFRQLELSLLVSNDTIVQVQLETDLLQHSYAVSGGCRQIRCRYLCSSDHNSLLIYGSLSKPTLDSFAHVTHLSTATSMIACLAMALAGFLTFGEATQGNVLNNFPVDNVMINVARL